MAAEATVSFKVYLITDKLGGKTPEVRRFGIDRDVVANFSYLQHKLQSIFPVLQGKSFVVSWKDSDGDDVVISSDEELIIALTEMQIDIRKLYVTLSEVRGGSNIPAGGNVDTIHFGVTCDVCNTSNIKGFRYKCLECADYDLCSTCEAKGHHTEHNMIRLTESNVFMPSDLSFFYNKMMKKVNHKYHHDAKHFNRGWESRCPYAKAKDEEHGKKKRKSEKHESSPESEDSGDNCESRHHGKKSKRHHAHHKNPYNWLFYDLPFWTTEGQTCEKKDEAKTPSGDAPHIRYLKTIGKTVADLLDPLGIDVDVEIRAKDDKKKESNETEVKKTEQEAAAAGTSSSPSKTTTPTAPPKEVKFADNVKPSTSKDAAAAAASSVDQITEDLAKQKMNDSVPEVDDFLWVPPRINGTHDLLTGSQISNKETPIQNNNNNIPTAPQANPTPAAANTGFIYPNLNFGVQQVQQHPNPAIAQALDRMLSMGFTNDGGWLTQLLEAKNGDIHKALDVLQPVKK